MARVSHSEAVKARALALYAEHGAAEAARHLAAEGHSVTATTIRKWASRSGLSRDTREKTEQATAANIAAAEERRTRLAARLLEIAEMAADEAAAAMAGARLSELVGLFTRAIHDHQLLTGAATSRTETTGTADTAHALLDELAARRTTRAA